MKKLLLVILLAVSSFLSHAQSGFRENRYYAQQYNVSDVCGSTYSVLQGYDYYGRPVYFGYQDCRHAEWYSYYGSYTGYFWVRDNYGNYFWQSRTEYRTWWYYTWSSYTRRVY